jgi:hypothetical protein
LNADHEQWQAIDQEQAYSASWSVVQFLMSTETNRRLMNTLLMEWQQERRRSIDCARQIDELYPKGLKAFEIAWHRWIDPTGTAGYYKTAFRGSGLCQFAVHGYNLAPALEASINQQVQSLLEKQRAFFNWEPDPAFHPRIRLFGDVTNYARFSINSRMMGAATKAEDLARIEGYYTPLSKEIVTVTIVSDSSQDLADRVLRLANTAILEEHFRNVPRWVILGSPHFFITPGQSGGDHRLALTNAWKRMGLASAKLPSLTSLLDGRQSRDLDSNHETEVICWGLFEFLASSDPSRQVLNAMLRDPPSGSGTARLEGHYRGGVARLGIDFKQWLDKTMGKSVEE